MILGNDDRPRTMHVEAERADRDVLPDVVADALERNDDRRSARRAVWSQHQATARKWRGGAERMAEHMVHADGIEVDGVGVAL